MRQLDQTNRFASKREFFIKTDVKKTSALDKEFFLSLTIILLLMSFLSVSTFASTKKSIKKPIICNSEALLNDIQNYRLGLNQAAEYYKSEGMGPCLYKRYLEVKSVKQAEAKKSIFKKANMTVMEYVSLIQKEVDKYADKRIARTEVCDIDEGAEIYDSTIEKCRETENDIQRIGSVSDE